MSDSSAGRLEELIHSDQPLDATLTDDQARQVTEQRAIRQRLARAYESVSMPEGMAERLTAALDLADSQPEPQRARVFRFPARLAATASIAAALIAVVLLWNLQPAQATATQAEFYKIHLAHLQPNPDEAYLRGQDRDALAQHLKQTAGKVPIMPHSAELAGRYCGCSPARFYDSTVASYVIVKPDGRRVSVVVVDKPVAQLGFTHPFTRDGKEFAWCSQNGCRMAATSIQGDTYVAIGKEFTEMELLDVLTAIRQAAAE
ncbi:MAG: hypothetical protein ACLFUJ_03450 [Phycisphaerae bacterium]